MKNAVYVSPFYYLPVKYAVGLVVNGGYDKEIAANLTVRRYAFYGKNKSKRLKEFNLKQFNHQFKMALEFTIAHPDAIIVRKSPRSNKR